MLEKWGRPGLRRADYLSTRRSELSAPFYLRAPSTRQPQKQRIPPMPPMAGKAAKTVGAPGKAAALAAAAAATEAATAAVAGHEQHDDDNDDEDPSPFVDLTADSPPPSDCDEPAPTLIPRPDATLTFILISNSHFTLMLSSHIVKRGTPRQILAALTLVPCISFDWAAKRWMVPITYHDQLHAILTHHHGVTVEALPPAILRAVTARLERAASNPNLAAALHPALPTR